MTVASPGPGVIMTLMNALRYGTRGAITGILGLAAGVCVIAALSSTGLGVLVATSALAYLVLKIIGAAYLIYLGVRLWMAPSVQFALPSAIQSNAHHRFWTAFALQFTNPKAIFFCLSVFPQFIDPQENYAQQFALLSMTYTMLILAIHMIYASCAARARNWLASDRGGRLLNRISGTMFILFGIALAFATR